MSGNILTDRIKKENIRFKLEIAPRYNKMREIRLRWFGHVQIRLIDTTVRKINCLEITGASRDRGERPKKTRIKTVRNDMKAINLTDKIALVGPNKIYVTNPMYWG